jgi:hypothetical protein
MKEMTEVSLNKKLSGLFPYDDWENPKRHLSALTKGGKVVAYGQSNLGGVPKICSTRGRSCHSEMEVLKYIGTDDKRKIKKYTMWNIRRSVEGEIVNSKPCLHCQQTLLNIGLTYIVFSTSDGTFKKSRISELICKPSSGFR